VSRGWLAPGTVFRARLLQLECVDFILLCPVAGMVVCFIVWLNHANKKKTCYNHTSITLVKRKAYLSLCVSYEMRFAENTN
jgi:hypothetical protein